MNIEPHLSPIERDRYGLPWERRRKELAESRVNPATGHSRIVVKGQVRDLEIIRVPIELPKYRLANGRTASLQEEWLAKHADQPEDFFAKDPELWEAQREQHKLLKELINQEGLQNLFKEPTQKQVESILLDEHGFVINGNRRLCCWRELYYGEPEKYPHFSHIDVVVLPHCDEKEIDRIEAELQIKQDVRADYSWQSRAIMMRLKQQMHHFNTIELAELYGLRKAEVEEMFDMLELASEYLKSRGKEKQWSLVSDEYAYRALRKAELKMSSVGERHLLRQSAFSLIDNSSQVGGRLYQEIPKIQEYFETIKEELTREFPVDIPEQDETTDELFGGSISIEQPDLSIPLAAEITKAENVVAARQVIVEAIKSADDRKREEKEGDALCALVRAANTKLQNAVMSGLRPESSTEGVEAQLNEIERRLAQIRTWLAERHA